MAHFAVTLAVISSLLVLSQSRTPFNQPANNVQLTEPLKPLEEPQVTTATEEPAQHIRLPTERPDSETATATDLPLSDNTNTIEADGITTTHLTEPLNDPSKSDVPVSTGDSNHVTVTLADLPLLEISTIEAIGVTRPFTVLHVERPRNGMPVKLPLRVRLPSRCRHHVRPPVISYENGMVVDRVGEVPGRLKRFSGAKRRFFDRRYYAKRGVGESKEKKEGGFLKRFREFQDHF